MGYDEVVSEAYSRWGETAAICRCSRRPVRYEVGYCEETGSQSIYHVMGSGHTLEVAFAEAGKSVAQAKGLRAASASL